jgi:hypothetical protein
MASLLFAFFSMWPPARSNSSSSRNFFLQATARKVSIWQLENERFPGVDELRVVEIRWQGSRRLRKDRVQKDVEMVDALLKETS